MCSSCLPETRWWSALFIMAFLEKDADKFAEWLREEGFKEEIVSIFQGKSSLAIEIR